MEDESLEKLTRFQIREGRQRRRRRIDLSLWLLIMSTGGLLIVDNVVKIPFHLTVYVL